MTGLNAAWQWLAEHTNKENYSGDLAGAVRGADVFIGVSAPNLLTGDDIAAMAKDSIVFALANPDPEVDPREARKYAAVVATGRSDQPNQINNVLAFPGVFRGMLDAHAEEFTEEMAIAAARAIADVVGEDKINPTVIVPSVFDSRVAPAVAAAVRAAAQNPAPPPAADPGPADLPELAAEASATPNPALPTPALSPALSPPQRTLLRPPLRPAPRPGGTVALVDLALSAPAFRTKPTIRGPKVQDRRAEVG